ncbi:hypothetical protein [Thermosyntropha sp.]|uniref:hypothetical protein n=1 Tax=Thermosyntropha sp. TaxID=2740820 RepID=UPI0025D559A1|nr:hypothetical protein [Thermosyntropha sp.]MBO8158030.1 hypothetical protein [Thermosyntropha sp.]
MVDWQVILHDDRKVKEKIIVNEPTREIAEFFGIKNDLNQEKLVKERTAASFEEYAGLSRSFPLKVEIENRFLWDRYFIESNYKENETLDFLINESDIIKFSIKIPGVIKSTCDGIKQGDAVVWKITDQKKPVIGVEALVPNGFNIALIILGIGFMLAIFYLINSIVKVNRIIEEEYSLDNIESLSSDRNQKKQDEGMANIYSLSDINDENIFQSEDKGD